MVLAQPQPAPRKPAAPIPPRPLEIGDIAPRFTLPGAKGEPVDLYGDTLGGRYVAIAFEPGPGDREGLRALVAHYPSRVLGVVVVKAQGLTEADAKEPFAVVHDPKGEAAAAYGAVGTGRIALMAPWQHVIALVEGADALAAEIDADRARWEGVDPNALALVHPPVLQVPRVLSPEDCKRLITIYKTDGNVILEPGHAKRGDQLPPHDYKMRIPDYGRKDRIDHWVVNEKTNGFLDARMRSRVFPEVRKAFHYKVTRREMYRIGHYAGERGGEAHGHRDNTEAFVAHRRFAMSINLNDDFEGGHLTFPEFGPQRYRPRAGDAIVFSSSIYHEPHGVTLGERYVLLAFLFGEV